MAKFAMLKAGDCGNLGEMIGCTCGDLMGEAGVQVCSFLF